MRFISEDAIQDQANYVRDRFVYFPSQAQVSSLATFIFYGYITEMHMHNMRLVNIDLSEVVHASSLADVTVADSVQIINVSGNIAPIISRITCPVLHTSRMRLSTEDTAALVQGMQTNVEKVQLGLDGPVELDMNTLLTYDGQGHCGQVWCYDETRERYGDQLATWGETMGWSVETNRVYVGIERN